MAQVKNEPSIIHICFFVKNSHDEGETISENTQDYIAYKLCFTFVDESGNLIMTSEMHELICQGYFMAAAVWFELNLPNVVDLWTPEWFSESVRSAFGKKVLDLVRAALVSNRRGSLGKIC
jgi:hypothetical protein